MFSQKKHKQYSPKRHDCDLESLMRDTKLNLMLDLADSDMRRLYCMKERGEQHPINDGCPPYPFKKIKQLVDFDKRIIWSKDRDNDEVKKESLQDFVISQNFFCLPEPIDRRELLVIQRAREICSRILGPFSYDTWFDQCSFGKRAALNLPRAKSYLDKRMERLNGTSMQVSAFKHVLSRDIHLFRAVRKRCRKIEICDAIKLTTVPKSWKAARIIAPDTIVGGFLSRGLGDYIRKQLERNTHINLSLQQERHRAWAREASKNGLLATLDMSKASDSFTWRHIELLVPEDWHHALDIVRTPKGFVGKELIELKSYMLMGSGHTFPLQTLLFFCLAEATQSLLKRRGVISVYGDDIIVPTFMSSFLISILSRLGFKINSAKSFFDMPDPDRPSHTFFRESCGGDFKGGFDVRPYMPECDLQSGRFVPRNEFIAWCHKIINGLLDHWDFEELPQTIMYLLRLINSKRRKICFVPEYETSHSGIKHYLPPYCLTDLDYSHVIHVNSQPYYWRLTFHQKRRARQEEERPYLWYAYYLHRNSSMRNDLYDSLISLNGESNKAVKGTYRWKLRCQGNWR